MQRRKIAIAAAAGALAVGGTAIAVADPGGGRFGAFAGPGDREAELAKGLASKLNGVSADEVQKALGELRKERQEEHLNEQAKALAAELDVDEAKVKAALQKARSKLEESFKNGERPDRPRDVFAETLASELDKKPEEIREAFQAAHKARFEQRIDEAVKEGRLTEKQADEMRKRLEEGRGFGKRFRFRHHGGPGGPGGPRGERPDILFAPGPGEPGDAVPAPPPPGA